MSALLAALGMILGFCVLGPLVVDGSRFDRRVAQAPAPPSSSSVAVAPVAASDAAAPDAGARTTVAIARVGEPILRTESGRAVATAAAIEAEKVVVYVPKTILLRDDRFDLVIHFHGPHERTRAALDRSELGAVMVSLNLGEGGTTYEDAATASGFLDRLTTAAERVVAESGRAPGGHVGRIAISSWSAGFGAVRETMKRPADAARIDGLLLADGLFTDWSSSPARKSAAARRAHPPEANLDKVAAVVEFARRATVGEKLFVLTHTSIDRRHYADAPDIAEELIRRFDIEKEFPDEPNRQSSNYAIDHRSFHIWSFGGKTWADHLAQHDAMRKHFSALKSFWSDG